MRYKLISIVGAVILLLAGFTLAQLTSSDLPSTFTVNLNELPSPHSEQQTIFGCPYNGDLEHKITKIYEITGDQTNSQVVLDVQFWTNGKTCAGSKSMTLTIPNSGNQQQITNNINAAINQAFLEEANAHHEGFSMVRPTISIGTSG